MFIGQADKNIASNVSAAWIDKCRVTAREVKLGQRYDQLLAPIREAFGQQCHAIRMRLNNDDVPCHDLNIDESRLTGRYQAAGTVGLRARPTVLRLR